MLLERWSQWDRGEEGRQGNEREEGEEEGGIWRDQFERKGE